MGLLSGWGKRLTFTLDKDQIDNALSGFPVLIYLSAASGIGDVDVSCFFDELGSDANRKKVAFTSSDGTTELYAEIERFDFASEKAWYHVKIPSVSATVDEIIYIYYDFAHADNTPYIGDTTDAVTHNVWDSDFEAVYHMGQDPNGDVADAIKDSTSNANDGTPVGTMLTEDLVDSKVGKGIDFDGVNDAINIGTINPGVGTSLTLEAVTYLKALPSSLADSLVGKYTDNDDRRSYYFTIDVSTNYLKLNLQEYLISFDASTVVHGETALNGETWYYCAATFLTESYLKVYLDGVINGTNTTDVPTDYHDSIEPVLISSDNNGIGHPSNDIKTEVRISSTARSAAWIKATYHSLWDSLGTFGAEEIVGDVIMVATPFTGTFSLTGAVTGGQKVTATPFTGTFSLTGVIRHIPRTQILGTINLINSLKVGSTLSLVNSLNIVFKGDITLVHDILSKIEGSQALRNDIENLAKFNDTLSLINHDILSKIEGSQALRNDIENLAKFNDTLSLINHILDADSGITQGDYYFLKNHGI